MKTPLLILSILVSLSFSAFATEVSQGMSIVDVKSELGEKGLKVSNQCQLSIEASDTNTILEFCNIDENITLIIAYDKSTSLITSLKLYFIPENRTSKTQAVVREALSVQLLEKGKFTFTIKTK